MLVLSRMLFVFLLPIVMLQTECLAMRCIDGSLSFTYPGTLKEVDLGSSANHMAVTVLESTDVNQTGTYFALNYTGKVSDALRVADVFKVDSGNQNKMNIFIEFFSVTPSTGSRNRLSLAALALTVASTRTNNVILPMAVLCGGATMTLGEDCVSSASILVILPFGHTFSRNGGVITILGSGETIAPTSPPVSGPTPTIVEGPTLQPSPASPSKSPTKLPTKKPTLQPTVQPTKEPTPPTLPPTRHPTEAPSCFTPSGIVRVKTGPVDPIHTVSVLQVNDQSGGQDDWPKYIEVNPTKNSGNQEVEYHIEFNVGTSFPAYANRVAMRMNYRGTDMYNKWFFSLLENTGGGTTSLGTNTGAGDWVWTMLEREAYFENEISEYLSNGKLRLKITAIPQPNLETIEIDYIQLCLHTAGPPTIPPPTPPPTTPPPTILPGVCKNPPDSNFESWSYQATICGVYFPQLATEAQVDTILQQRLTEGCTALMLDTRLSYYLSETQFTNEDVPFITYVATKAKELGMTTTLYYPTLEVITANAVTPSGQSTGNPTMARDHPDWVQRGLNADKTQNIFYGGKEEWVNEGEESAWMCPEHPDYVNFFTNRVRQLARTPLDGFWGDVPLYYDTGVAWAGASHYAELAFKAWSKAQGYCLPNGCGLPDHVPLANYDFSQLEFKYWKVWRHHSLASFLEKIRAALREEDPKMFFVVEVYNTDYMDSVTNGLDPSYYKDQSDAGMTNVWEIDSVSNTKAMRMASNEDMANQVTMRKFARGVDRDKPSWTFGYGYQAVDASFVLSGAFAVGSQTLETKTPSMTDTSDVAMRTQFYNWAKKYLCEIYQIPRIATAAILYSTRTRDMKDFGGKCWYGMYLETVSNGDSDYWAGNPPAADDTVANCQHVGSYRGASFAFQILNMQYKIVIDTQLKLSDLDGVKLLWLPDTTVLPEAAIQVIKQFAQNGGTVLATGPVQPGNFDEFGNSRRLSNPNPLKDVFKEFVPSTGKAYTHKYGAGVGIYRGDIDARKFFVWKGLNGHSGELQKELLKTLTGIVRTHVPERLIVRDKNVKNLHVEMSVVTDQDTQHVYVFNYDGMKQPAVHSRQTIPLWFQAPRGKVVSGIGIATPNESPASSGSVGFKPLGDGWVELDPIVVDQFTLLTVHYSDRATQQHGSGYSASHAAQAMSFIKNKMRDGSKPVPFKYGVFTNYKDSDTDEDLYAYAHHTTSEHMGLLLRSAACMRDETAWAESKTYIRDAMQSPALKLVNWAMHKTTNKPFTTADTSTPGLTIHWQSTAPLDDFRVVVGLLEGSAYFSDSDEGYEIAAAALRGMFWTSVTYQHSDYPGGLLCLSYDWEEMDPRAFGVGTCFGDYIPVNYQDLGALEVAAKLNPRWISVLKEALKLILDSEISSSGLYYNRYTQSKTFGGDWENTDNNAGLHLKTIQEMWNGIHLAKMKDSIFLAQDKKDLATAAALRTWNFYWNFYQSNNKMIPEYLKFDGTPVPACTSGDTIPAGCLRVPTDNSDIGETRIYALLVRLGHYLNIDENLLKQIITDKIIPDRVVDASDDRFGMFGLESVTRDGRADDSDAWQSLETIFSLCLVKY